MAVKKILPRVWLGWMLCFVAGPPVSAHEGHAGEMVEFLGTKEALREMLPEGAKVLRRKEALGEEAVTWAKDRYAIELRPGIYTYFLARDRDTGRTLAAAMIFEIEHRHGAVKLGVGVDAQGRITRAGTLGVHSAYIGDVDHAVGKGFDAHYDGRELNALGGGSDSEGLRGRVAGAVRERAILLAALMRQAAE